MQPDEIINNQEMVCTRIFTVLNTELEKNVFHANGNFESFALSPKYLYKKLFFLTNN